MRIRLIIINIVVLAIVAAGAPLNAYTDEELGPVAAHLTKLAAAVDSFVATTPDAASMTEREVFRRSTLRDSSLLAAFDDYVLRLRIEGRNSAILVCSRDRQQAFIEDAGCSARSDQQHWRAPSPRPCQFTLNLNQICGP